MIHLGDTQGGQGRDHGVIGTDVMKTVKTLSWQEKAFQGPPASTGLGNSSRTQGASIFFEVVVISAENTQPKTNVNSKMRVVLQRMIISTNFKKKSILRCRNEHMDTQGGRRGKINWKTGIGI